MSCSGYDAISWGGRSSRRRFQGGGCLGPPGLALRLDSQTVASQTADRAVGLAGEAAWQASVACYFLAAV